MFVLSGEHDATLVAQKAGVGFGTALSPFSAIPDITMLIKVCVPTHIKNIYTYHVALEYAFNSK